MVSFIEKWSVLIFCLIKKCLEYLKSVVDDGLLILAE